MGSDLESLLASGLSALARCDWRAAQAEFEAAASIEETAEALDGLAGSLYWQGEYERTIELWARAYRGYRAGRDDRAAAFTAFRLATIYAWVYGNGAAMSGWLAHADRHLDVAGDCPERGWVEHFLATISSDPEERERRARTAIEIGRRFDEAGLEYNGIARLGEILVARGTVDEGMRLIDEALAATTSGIVSDPWAAGEIYCTLFSACEMVIDVRRAEEWLHAVEDYVTRTGELPIAGICRMHYGGLLTSAGRWADAEQELTSAIEIYDSTWRDTRYGPVLRLAELRVLQGRIEEAEQLIVGYEEHLEAAQPRARIHLARGEPRVARTILERHLTRRGRGIASVPALALLVSACLDEGNLSAARDVATEIERLAEISAQRVVRGISALCAARVAVASGEAATALFEEAIANLADAGLPYELAIARLELASCLREEEPEVARVEARAALVRLQELSASREANAAAELLREMGDHSRPWPRSSGELTSRELEVLDLVAEGLSNAQIAERLYISPRTAEHHVGSILGKLGLSNRTEAAAYAARHR